MVADFLYYNMSGRIRWCFTLNNYSEEEYDLFCTFGNDYCKYFVMGREVGKEGTPHLQGYFSLKKKKTLEGLR